MKKNIFKINLFLKLLIFIFLFFLSVLSFPLLINFETKKSFYEEIISQALHDNVKIEGKIDYSFSQGPKIHFENLIFENSNQQLNGNINSLAALINPLDFFTNKIKFHRIYIEKGSLSVTQNYINSFIVQNHLLKKLNFKNIDIKIYNNFSEIQFDNSSGNLQFSKNQLNFIKSQGDFGTLKYDFLFQNEKIRFEMPEIKFNIIYNINKINKTPVIQVQYANEILFPQFKNISAKSEINYKPNLKKINFNNIIVTSSIFSGNGSIELLYEQDLFTRSKFSFYRTNFNNLELKKLSNFFQKNLFLISNDINASIEIELSNIILYKNYFDNIKLYISFENGDIILHNIDFASDKNFLSIKGRIIKDNNDRLMFFESKFKTEDLKKLCVQICKSKIQKNNLEVDFVGSFNIGKSKFNLDQIKGLNSFAKADLSTINTSLNKLIDGNFEKALFLDNYLSLF